jgi:arginine repressor
VSSVDEARPHPSFAKSGRFSLTEAAQAVIVLVNRGYAAVINADLDRYFMKSIAGRIAADGDVLLKAIVNALQRQTKD